MHRCEGWGVTRRLDEFSDLKLVPWNKGEHYLDLELCQACEDEVWATLDRARGRRQQQRKKGADGGSKPISALRSPAKPCSGPQDPTSQRG